MRRAVFFDRDGVVNTVVWRNGKPASPRSLAEFVLDDGIGPVVLQCADAGYLIFIVTNQPDIRRGLLEPAVLTSMHRTLSNALRPNAIRACCHDDRDGCACRKPRPGMLHDLAHEFDVDLNLSWMIGDQDRDMQCGRAAGCTTIQLERDYNTGSDADYRVASLADIPRLLLPRGANLTKTASISRGASC